MAGRSYNMTKRRFGVLAVDKFARKLEDSLPHYEVMTISTLLRSDPRLAGEARKAKLCWEGVLRHKETGKERTIGSYDYLADCLKLGYKMQFDHPEWKEVEKLERDIIIYANKPVEKGDG